MAKRYDDADMSKVVKRVVSFFKPFGGSFANQPINEVPLFYCHMLYEPFYILVCVCVCVCVGDVQVHAHRLSAI